MASQDRWQPPDFISRTSRRPIEIERTFKSLFPTETHGRLAEKIAGYWIRRLAEVWNRKGEKVKQMDLAYRPSTPLTRIRQRAVVIAYADSVREKGKATLSTLEAFLRSRFPAVGGLHLLPSCEMSDRRFNDGGFSQIRRDRIHRPFGTNKQFERLMADYFSMADFVLNHVDIEHPRFQAYLNGDDLSGECFFIFSEPEYQKRLDRGDFDRIFRPRPFPLFTLFRRKPAVGFGDMFPDGRFRVLNDRFRSHGLSHLPDAVIGILYLFEKIKNDQMLIDQDYRYLERFVDFLKRDAGMDPNSLLAVSTTQETRDTPHVFKDLELTPVKLLSQVLPGVGIPNGLAPAYARIYGDSDTELFGQPVRALTTFSHVQVDLNTATFEGLKLLIDDFSWYLGMDLNMLRLDAANFAFKKWSTTCFGLPEVTGLMKVIYLSMACVSPRMVPNLEVNAPLGIILNQMADKTAPPPMMYDFHLACMLPVVFNTCDARPLLKIQKLIGKFKIPHDSIRFSLDESHDGKSVPGSGGEAPLLSYAQRRELTDIVIENGGHVKYKTAPRGQISPAAFEKICTEAGIDPATAVAVLFEESDNHETLTVKAAVQSDSEMARLLGIPSAMMQTEPALAFLVDLIFHGREPYELCVATRNALRTLAAPDLEIRRYLALKTLAFALMGRHVKAVYFNDLMGLGNDFERVEKTGELRNIKRTKSVLQDLETWLNDSNRIEGRIASGMNDLVALVDADPAFGPKGDEASVTVDPSCPSVAVVHAACGGHYTIVVVNTRGRPEQVAIDPSPFGHNVDVLYDNIAGNTFDAFSEANALTVHMEPYGRLWLTEVPIERDSAMLLNG